MAGGEPVPTSASTDPSQIYLRAATDQVDDVHAQLAVTANPEHPNQVTVSRPTDALVVRAAAQSALNRLFLGLAAVSLLVGAVGVANTMRRAGEFSGRIRARTA